MRILQWPSRVSMTIFFLLVLVVVNQFSTDSSAPPEEPENLTDEQVRDIIERAKPTPEPDLSKSEAT